MLIVGGAGGDNYLVQGAIISRRQFYKHSASLSLHRVISRDTSFVWTLEWGKTDLEIHSSCCLLSRPGDPDVVRSFISIMYVTFWKNDDNIVTGWQDDWKLRRRLAVWSMVSTIYIYFLSCSEMNGSVQFALKMRWRPSNILLFIHIICKLKVWNLREPSFVSSSKGGPELRPVWKCVPSLSVILATESSRAATLHHGRWSHVTRDTRDHCCVRGTQWEYDNLIKWSTMSRSISNWIVNCATYNLVHTSRGIKWISVKLLNTTY